MVTQSITTERALSRTAAVEPSARTIAVGNASDQLREYVDALKLQHRLTAGELAVMLAGEQMRAAGSELARERATGEAVPLCLRYIRPASEDMRVAEADAITDGIASAALAG